MSKNKGKSKIEWTEETWNTVTGCTKVSEGCRNCYAERMTKRLEKMHPSKYGVGFGVVVCHYDELNKPYKSKKPKTYFLNSMSDTFHKDVTDDFIFKIFEVMNDCPQHTFQVLTKRSERLRELAPSINWTPNIWMGVSVENQEMADKRIPDLLSTPAKVKFLSMEPLLGPVDISGYLACPSCGGDGKIMYYECYGGQPIEVFKDCEDCLNNTIDWVIVGGETGFDVKDDAGKIIRSPRPMHPAWVRSIRDQCVAAKIHFFFKQWGEYSVFHEVSGSPEFSRNESLHHWMCKSSCVSSPIAIDFCGKEIRHVSLSNEAKYPIVIMQKVGKKKSGSLLDGQEWKQMPEVVK